MTVKEVFGLVGSTSFFGYVAETFVGGLKSFFHVVLLLTFWSLKCDVFNLNVFECLFPDLKSVSFSLLLRNTQIKPDEGKVIVKVRNRNTSDGFTIKYSNPVWVFIEKLEGQMFILAKVPANIISPVPNCLIVFGVEVSDDKGHLEDRFCSIAIAQN